MDKDAECIGCGAKQVAMPDRNSELNKLKTELFNILDLRIYDAHERAAYRRTFEKYVSAHTTAVLDRVAEEVIGENTPRQIDNSRDVYENGLRSRQRTALSQIRKELL